MSKAPDFFCGIFLQNFSDRVSNFWLQGPLYTSAPSTAAPKSQTGMRATSEGAKLEIRAYLVIAASGRHSTLRERADFVVEDLGAPMEVLWMRITIQTITLSPPAPPRSIRIALTSPRRRGDTIRPQNAPFEVWCFGVSP
jgi:2-polyprenyl-6-methoxyphenol hydroxylase-like FAD-dependent oxidoreductase